MPKKKPAPPVTKKPEPPKANPRAIPVCPTSYEDIDAASARAITGPTEQAAITLYDIGKNFPATVTDLNNELLAQSKKVHNGDMKRAETMLTAQAHTLDALFNNLTRAALVSETLNQYETKFRLALRAQAQCRATLETISAIKNPPVIFAKQANITSGPQQINNGTVSRAGENGNAPNKQLQHTPSERLDLGAQSTASGINSSVEAMAEIQRA